MNADEQRARLGKGSKSESGLDELRLARIPLSGARPGTAGL
jgi:hypothetical protein